jgi:lipopolysaccharide transport system ATP-binding protein
MQDSAKEMTPLAASDVLVSADSVRKVYQKQATLGFANSLRLIFGGSLPVPDDGFVALDHVGITVHRGETVGIVGRNGSGKSTLLQIIAGTLQASAGSVQVHGRLAALLELGAGFNPEFTGRENIFVAAAVAGLKRDEILARYDDIVNFAEIGAYIDQPVKTYSSGMFVRLAFSLAINVDPDVLIVDEALSVGDEAFQRKCFARLERFRGNGGTLLFVTHHPGTILQLCDRALLLDQGRQLYFGNPRDALTLYQRVLYAPEAERDALRARIVDDPDAVLKRQKPAAVSPDPSDRSDVGDAGAVGDVAEADRGLAGFLPEMQSASQVVYAENGAVIHNVRLVDSAGEPCNVLVRGRRYSICYDIDFTDDAHWVSFQVVIKMVSGYGLAGMITDSVEFQSEVVDQGTKGSARFGFECRLNEGTYFFNVAVTAARDDDRVYLHRIVDADIFRVAEDSAQAEGVVDLGLTANIDLQRQTTGP